MSRPRVVVTGSTRGIGLGLACELAARGCSVAVSGRSQHAVDQAVAAVRNRAAAGTEVAGAAGDVADVGDLQRLWDTAVGTLGGVDIWVNNAGVNQPRRNVTDLDPREIRAVVGTNLVGTLNGCRVAARHMVAQRSGAIYLMEGFGSDNRVAEGISVYGATKRAVRYATKALAKELRGTGVIAGALSPGIVLTDLLLDDGDPDETRRAKAHKVFNILGDTVETVTPWLASRLLTNTRNGARIAWLTPGRAARRFATAPVTRRDPLGDRERATVSTDGGQQ